MTHKFERFRDFGKTIAPMLLIMWGCIILFFFILDSVLPSGEETEIPVIEFRNISPCLQDGRDLVVRFEERDSQYICADMDTAEKNVFLELHVYRSENKKQVYIASGTFSSGQIVFYIDHLPPGKYEAWIFWARTNLASVEFEVVESK